MRTAPPRHPSARRSPSGFIGLLTVIVLGSMVLALGISTAFIGQTELTLATHADYEYAVRELVSACLEETTYRLGLNSGYTGGTVPLGNDSCVAAVTGAGGTRSVALIATVNTYTKRVTATATLRQNTAGNAGGWSITAWQEGDPP